MAKYKVNKGFTDKETKQSHVKGDEIDITVKRGDEINEKLKKHGTIVQRVHETKEDTVE